MIEAVLAQKIDELIKTLSAPKIPDSKRLWTSKECADYMSCSAKHFTTRIATRPSFPVPINLNQGRNGTYRWLATEVMNWTIGNRSK